MHGGVDHTFSMSKRSPSVSLTTMASAWSSTPMFLDSLSSSDRRNDGVEPVLMALLMSPTPTKNVSKSADDDDDDDGGKTWIYRETRGLDWENNSRHRLDHQ